MHPDVYLYRVIKWHRLSIFMSLVVSTVAWIKGRKSKYFQFSGKLKYLYF